MNAAFRLTATLPVVVLAAALAACQPAEVPRPSISQLRPDEIILVGRIELVPPLAPGEQHLSGFPWAITLPNQAQLFIASRREELKTLRGDGGLSGPNTVTIGTTFYIRTQGGRVHLNGIRFPLVVDSRRSTESEEWAWLPTDFVIDIESGIRAAYIGTLRYDRDVFFNILRFGVIDEYLAELPEFQRKFGPSTQLARRLATREAQSFGGTGARQ